MNVSIMGEPFSTCISMDSNGSYPCLEMTDAEEQAVVVAVQRVGPQMYLIHTF